MEQTAVTLGWLDGAPPSHPCGVSWGVPWPQGKFQTDTTFSLTAPGGDAVPVQSWPLAFWPDGSLKWTGHAVRAGPEAGESLQLAPGAPTPPARPVRVQETAEGFAIDTGALQCRVPRAGEFFLTSLSVRGRVVAQAGRLVCLREDRSRQETERVTQEEEFTSRIDGVTLEQSGPVRAVVKIEGQHQSTSRSRTWLPFVLRLYFHAGLDTVRLMHTFVFDGDQERDFIRSLGVSVPAVKDYERLPETLAGFHFVVFAILMLLKAAPLLKSA